MWNRIFLTSVVIFLFGTVALVIGAFLLPEESEIALSLGAAMAGIGGTAAGISGLVLIWATDPRD